MDTINKLQGRHFILASQSPRRQNIFKSLGLDFSIKVLEIDETFPNHLKGGDIPSYLAELKAEPHRPNLEVNQILVTADTVVWINDHVLNKPADLNEAAEMLREISGSIHEVHTAVSLTTNSKQHTFVESTRVHFHELAESEIAYYLERYAPLDKAGAYGIQEFIGYIGIKSVEGDFYNVVGFPVQRFWRELQSILN